MAFTVICKHAAWSWHDSVEHYHMDMLAIDILDCVVTETETQNGHINLMLELAKSLQAYCWPL
jgi:hypothetical protein